MSKMPPVPPENRSSKGPGGARKPSADTTEDQELDNLDQQDRHGNIKQNTTNQGDRQAR